MAMTISDLPEDLLRLIVRRVMLKDMRAVRLTCKKWDTLCKSGSFRKTLHMCTEEAAREEGESRVIALIDWNLHLISVVMDDVDHPSTEIIGKLSCLGQPRQQEKIIKVCHCDGLLLCVLKDTFRLLVLNPFLGQSRWIEPPSFSFPCERDVYDNYRYALGYEYDYNKKKSHKILRFIDVTMWLHGRMFRYEIYDFDSNLWKTLDVGTPHWSTIASYDDCVPLKGNTYWLAKDSYANRYEYDGLVCFDFTNERFGPILLPLPFPIEGNQDAVLSCLRGDKLALLVKFPEPIVDEIWVTTGIDPSKVSWSKFLILDRRPDIPKLYSLFLIGFLIDEKKKVAMFFDQKGKLSIVGEAGFVRQVDPPVDAPLHGTYNSPDVCFLYTPSLVQIL